MHSAGRAAGGGTGPAKAQPGEQQQQENNSPSPVPALLCAALQEVGRLGRLGGGRPLDDTQGSFPTDGTRRREWQVLRESWTTPQGETEDVLHASIHGPARRYPGGVLKVIVVPEGALGYAKYCSNRRAW